jgi:hypothetical protein
MSAILSPNDMNWSNQCEKFTKQMITSRERRIATYLLKLKTQFIGQVRENRIERGKVMQ